MTAGTAPVGPVRTCIACGKSDTDPKHGIATAPDVIAFHHVECGPLLDPPCGTADPEMRVCAEQLEGWNGERGQGLRDHIVNRQGALAALAADDTRIAAERAEKENA